jgi:UPF0059 membrane protein BAD_1445
MLIQILLIGVSVSMDAFAVSIGKGLTVKKLRGVDAFKTALWFGGFQALSLCSAISRPARSANT